MLIFSLYSTPEQSLVSRKLTQSPTYYCYTNINVDESIIPLKDFLKLKVGRSTIPAETGNAQVPCFLYLP
jgi:hypothetical protein